MQDPDYKRRLKKRMIIVLSALGILFCLIFLIDVVRSAIVKHFVSQFTQQTVTISTSIAKAETWHPQITSIGSLVASNGVQVSSQLSGMVTAIYFSSGRIVEKGQPLIQLDNRTDLEDLANYKAQLKLSQVNYDRQVSLLKTNATSQSSLDQAAANLQQSQSAVGKTEVTIDQKLIKAPFSGKLGIRNVNIGQYASPGTPLVNLQALNPLLLQFSVPEQNLRYLRVGQPIEFSVETYPGETFKGTVSATESAVDVQTRNIMVEATVPNPKMRLFPGSFANIRVQLPEQKNVVTVPQTAISASLFGSTVYVVKPAGKDKNGKQLHTAHLVYVTTGEMRGNEVEILKGIQAGDEVVNAGQLKLQDGASVSINNSVQLAPLTPEQLSQDRS
ncbi:MAG: efflux RND transporter periplasmic adaptor subunit [Gammaproteobacteria bacterium]